MAEIKQMSFQEKYKMVLEYHKGLEGEVMPLILERLGQRKVEEIKYVWQEELKPIPENATNEEKYDIAY